MAYISKNCIEGTSNVIEYEIRNILKVAHHKNHEKGVTGALLYSGGYFCQIIEGDQEVLNELFQIIQIDNRHKDVTMLHFAPIKYRVFEDWAMAYAGIENEMYFHIDGLLESKSNLKMKETGQNLLNVLETLVKQHQNMLNSAS